MKKYFSFTALILICLKAYAIPGAVKLDIPSDRKSATVHLQGDAAAKILEFMENSSGTSGGKHVHCDPNSEAGNCSVTIHPDHELGAEDVSDGSSMGNANFDESTHVFTMNGEAARQLSLVLQSKQAYAENCTRKKPVRCSFQVLGDGSIEPSATMASPF